MPVNSEGRAIFSDLVKGVMSFESDTATNFNYATATVSGSGSIGNIGIPVVWNGSAFEVFEAQDIAAAAASDLPGGAKVALVVGDKLGAGQNSGDTDLTTPAEVTVLYRGDATIVNEGIVWGAAAAPAQALFLAELEAQRITTIANAEVVTPTYG